MPCPLLGVGASGKTNHARIHEIAGEKLCSEVGALPGKLVGYKNKKTARVIGAKIKQTKIAFVVSGQRRQIGARLHAYLLRSHVVLSRQQRASVVVPYAAGGAFALASRCERSMTHCCCVTRVREND